MVTATRSRKTKTSLETRPPGEFEHPVQVGVTAAASSEVKLETSEQLAAFDETPLSAAPPKQGEAAPSMREIDWTKPSPKRF
jgi:hypothetical protein